MKVSDTTKGYKNKGYYRSNPLITSNEIYLGDVTRNNTHQNIHLCTKWKQMIEMKDNIVSVNTV